MIFVLAVILSISHNPGGCHNKYNYHMIHFGSTMGDVCIGKFMHGHWTDVFVMAVKVKTSDDPGGITGGKCVLINQG